MADKKVNSTFNLQMTIKRLSCFLLTFFVIFLFSSNFGYAGNKLQETKRKIKNLKILEKKEMNKLNKNQIKLENATKELDYSKARYSSTEARLVNLEQQYSSALADYNKTDYRVRNRIAQIYKHHTNGLVAMLLSSEDINDLLDKIYFQNIISKNDKEIFDRAKAKAKNIAKLKYDMEMQKSYLERSIRDINNQQKSIQQAINNNEKYIQKLKTDRATFEKAERELAKNSSNIENMISRNSKKTQNTVSTSGAFMRPIGGPVTSSFGYRIHPIFKSRIFHSGIDIGGPNNGPVKAANNGKVIYAGWYGGYGKVVILDHGNYNGSPTTTLYAHLNTISVAVGQYVVKGQVVGKEGSTGYATGPHVHFEVRVNGQPRNPLNYI